jgi:hypothetical protein
VVDVSRRRKTVGQLGREDVAVQAQQLGGSCRVAGCYATVGGLLVCVRVNA